MIDPPRCPGSIIEPSHDLFDLLIAHLVKIRPLRKVLAYQTMGIFIDAPRPFAMTSCPANSNPLSRMIVKIFAVSVSMPSTAALASSADVCLADA